MTGSTPKHTLPTFVLVLAGVILLRHGTSTIASSSCAVAFVSMSSSSSFSHNLQQSFPRALPFRNSNNDDDKVNRPQNNLDNGEQSTPLPLKVPSSSSSSSSSWLFQQQQQQSRQGFFQSALSNAVAAALGVSTTTASSSSFCQPAWARGLVQFPAPLLANTYHFMHAGTSLLEEEGMWSTNPLFLTNREDALSPTGEEQVVASCELLKQGTRPPTLVKYSLAASSIDAANIVGRELKLGRDRLVPEFTFLDPRAIGAWDMSARDTTLSAVWAMDFDEAGNDGLKGRPPAHEDGTPNEVLADQAIRLRQLMSILESQYSGDTILLIFPDSTGPALLSAMIAGIPYSRAHQLEYEPGEIRFEVTMDSTLSLMQKKELEEGSKFRETLRQGRKHLQQLRATEANGGIVVNLKDQKLDEERLAIEQALEAKEEERLRTEQIQQEKRQARQREMEKAFNARESGGFNAPVTAWGAAAAALASVAGVSWSRGDDYNMGAQSSDTLLAINSTDLLIGRQKRRSNSESVLELSANSVTGGLYASTPFGTTTDIRSATGNNRIRSISSPVDRQVAADRAMEEYMNKDDGADDWLASISQMIADPEFLVNEETFLASTADSLPPKPLPSGNFSIGVHEDVKEPINKFDTELLASAEELPSSWDDGGFQ